MHLGVGRIEEEAEGVLDLPHDARLGHCRPGQAHREQHRNGRRRALLMPGIVPRSAYRGREAQPLPIKRGTANALPQS